MAPEPSRKMKSAPGELKAFLQPELLVELPQDVHREDVGLEHLLVVQRGRHADAEQRGQVEADRAFGAVLAHGDDRLGNVAVRGEREQVERGEQPRHGDDGEAQIARRPDCMPPDKPTGQDRLAGVVIFPESGRSTLLISLIRVDLPAPLRPINPTLKPAGMSERSRKTTLRPRSVR